MRDHRRAAAETAAPPLGIQRDGKTNRADDGNVGDRATPGDFNGARPLSGAGIRADDGDQGCPYTEDDRNHHQLQAHCQSIAGQPLHAEVTQESGGDE